MPKAPTTKKKKKKKHRCYICGYFSRTLKELGEHMRRHTGEKPFECPECGRCFSLKSTVRSHCKRMHGIQLPTKNHPGGPV